MMGNLVSPVVQGGREYQAFLGIMEQTVTLVFQDRKENLERTVDLVRGGGGGGGQLR